jgi:phospholipase/carboxylesterase
VIKLIQDEIELLGDSKRIFLGGFSQGCSLALATYILYNQAPLGGILGCSGLFCTDVDWAKIDTKEKEKVPVLLYHGKSDSLIDVEFAEKTYLKLRNAGVKTIEFIKEEGLDHTTSETQCDVISRWLKTHMQLQ